MGLIFDERHAMKLSQDRFATEAECMAAFSIQDGEDLKKRFGSTRELAPAIGLVGNNPRC